MAVYKFHSLRVPFRVGYLMAKEARKRRMSVNGFVVEILMNHFADRLKNWKPNDEKQMRDQFTEKEGG